MNARTQDIDSEPAATAPGGGGVGEGNPLRSTKELAAMFGCTERTIRNWGYRGLITPIRMGRTVRFSLAEIERLCAAGPERDEAKTSV
jgi:excisionase family DNA binding protein